MRSRRENANLHPPRYRVRALLTTTNFASRDHRGKRSAERRMLTMSALTRGCAASAGGAPAFRRSRSRRSIGYHPDGSAPEPGFLKARRWSVLPVRRIRLELSTLRADRSFCRSTGDPKPPGSGAHVLRARAPRLAPSFESALAKGALC